MLEIDNKYDKIIQYYDKLASSGNTRFKEPLTRALSLFRSGYWDISISSQFRNYWIALEQLIDSASKTKPVKKPKSSTISKSKNPTKSIIERIIEYVPRLTINWQSAQQSYNINGMLGSLMAEIRNNQKLTVQLSKSRKLRQWENDPITIIENIQYFLRRIRKKTAKSHLRELKEMFSGKKRRKLRNNIVDLRQREELRLGILYARRNMLTHEGTPYFEAEKIYVQNMERLLLDVLQAFLSHIDAKNLDELIRKCNRPLEIRMRN